MELAHIPFEALKVSPQNMRHSRKKPDISDILPSIRARGIQQPLLVRKNGKGYEIVAGRRRYFSLRTLAKGGEKIGPVPCAVMEAGDDAAAIEASLIENIARLVPDEMTRHETFSKLMEAGRSVEDIAATFGVSELMVRRALALGNLLPAIRDTYRAGRIDAATLRHLTLASAEKQQEWLTLFEDDEAYTPTGRSLKAWLFGGDISTKVALFDLESYPGRIVRDLFVDEGVFEDVSAFWAAQDAAIARARDTYLEGGWAEVEIMERGSFFSAWEHVKAAREDGGRVYIEVRESGEVSFHEGYLTMREHRARERAEARMGGAGTPSSDRPELTKAAQNYIALHRHGAVRTSLMTAPKVALRGMLAHAIAGSSLWHTEAEPQRADRNATAASLESSKAQADFEAERKAVLKLIGLATHSHTLVRASANEGRLVALFDRLMDLSDAKVMRILTFLMAETLSSGTAIVERLGLALKVDMKDWWQPDDAFFDLLRDKAALNAMVRDVGGREVADANVSATTRVQKTIIRDHLSGTGRKKVEDWLPAYMAFPFRAYTPRGGGSLSDTETVLKEAHL
ncbi:MULTISPECIES: ParB/RepB/Spo0J family partition protein [Kordiimonas]|jgi:ParB family chromosome partitioning protein|uniref:ParB/RepB/Spo0J family partition protein n=1 Tax=Kordiimonas TaxID=288021 RepID=UPI00257ADDC9|nr:ParB/RepB/Spo0J family partition protein [Kordiimonas sp. UBA4487]